MHMVKSTIYINTNTVAVELRILVLLHLNDFTGLTLVGKGGTRRRRVRFPPGSHFQHA